MVQPPPAKDLVGIDPMRPRRPGHPRTRRERLFDNPPPFLFRPATSRPLTALGDSRINSSVKTQARSHHPSSFACRPAAGPGGSHRTLTLAAREFAEWDLQCALTEPVKDDGEISRRAFALRRGHGCIVLLTWLSRRGGCSPGQVQPVLSRA